MDDVRSPLPTADEPSNRSGRLSRRSLLAVTAAVPASAVAFSTIPARAEPGAGTLTDIPLDGVDHRSVGGALVRVLPDTAATMVGVTWSADDADSAEVVVQVRGKAEGADWTPWSVLETAVDPESGTEVPGTEIAWLGEVSVLEIRGEFDGADATSAMTAHVLLTEEQGADAALAADKVPQDASSSRSATTSASTTAASSPTLYGAPPIIRRATWGADEGATRGTSSLDELKSVVVHHTAGTNSYTKSQSAQIVRGIQAYHTGTLDWADVGYNLLIDKYGQIFEGRHGGLHRTIQGAHARGFNESTVGISVLGDYSSASLSTAALDAIAAVAAWKLLGTFRTSVTQTSSFYVSADGVVPKQGSTVKLPRFFGHRDVNFTECPGDGVYSKFSRIRDAIQSRIDKGWRIHLDAYTRGGGSALGTVTQVAHRVGDFRVTRLTRGLVLSQGEGAATATATPFAADWQASWGRPKGAARTAASGAITQTFAAGTASRPSASGPVTFTAGSGAPDYEVYGAIRSAWLAGGGEAALGAPVGPERAVGTGRQQPFERCLVSWKSGIGAFVTRGAIGTRWSSNGGAAGFLGFPRAGERAVTGGATQVFEHGDIHYSPATGAHATHGAIAAYWARTGWQTGSLGFPSGEEERITGGVQQRFQGGTVRWSSATGAVSVVR